MFKTNGDSKLSQRGVCVRVLIHLDWQPLQGVAFVPGVLYIGYKKSKLMDGWK